MRPLSLLLPLLLLLTACDSGSTSSDLDIGSFRGFDASVQAGINGGAFHDMTRAEASDLPTLPVYFELSSAELGSRTVSLSIGRPFVTGTYTLAEGAAEASPWTQTIAATVQEPATGGSVTITEVRPRGDYADVYGTVELDFPSGTLTGTFRAIDRSTRPALVECTSTDCVRY